MTPGVFAVLVAATCVLAYGVAWAKENIRNERRALIYCLWLVLVTAGTAGSIYYFQFLDQRVQPVLRYAYEECAYRGAVIHADPDRIILEGEPIKRVFKAGAEYPFRFGIYNGNGEFGLPMRDVHIQIIFKDTPDGFEVRPEPGRSGKWLTEDPNRIFASKFSSVTAQDWVVDAALFVKFPERRTYKAEIQFAPDGMSRIDRPFEIKLVDTCAAATTIPAPPGPTWIQSFLLPLDPRIPIATDTTTNAPRQK